MPVTIGGGLPFCGRELTSSEWDLIREVTRDFSSLGLTELARTICELLEWRRPNGGLKGRECYLFLLTLRSRGWLPWLPPPRPQARHPHTTTVDRQSDSQAPCTNPLQSCLLFTSAAWKMAPRDQYIGWSDRSRKSNLAQVVNNSRFLILPWVRIPHLASHILSRTARQLRLDWRERYGVDPVLLETLVDRERYSGTCYRAANWVSVGWTQGRGRMDRTRKEQGSCKEIFLYPLDRRWQSQLCEPATERPLAIALRTGRKKHEPAGNL